MEFQPEKNMKALNLIDDHQFFAQNGVGFKELKIIHSTWKSTDIDPLVNNILQDFSVSIHQLDGGKLIDILADGERVLRRIGVNKEAFIVQFFASADNTSQIQN